MDTDLVGRRITSKFTGSRGKILDIGEKYIIIEWYEVGTPMPLKINKFLDMVECDNETKEYLFNKIGNVLPNNSK